MPATPPTPSDAAATHAEAATRVLRQFRLVYNGVKSQFQQVEKLAGVGGVRVWALSVIGERPGIGVNELARALDVRQPTASNLARALAERALIEVRRDPHDGRAVRLHLRRPGAQILRRAPGPFAGALPQSLARLDLDTLQRLERDLATLIDALDPDDQDARAPPGGL